MLLRCAHQKDTGQLSLAARREIFLSDVKRKNSSESG